MPIQYFGQSTRLSEATIANGFVFLSGMVPEVSGDATTQTHNVLAQIDQWLAQCGSNKNQIVEATIFLANMADYTAMNTAWDEWISPEHSPARACVAAQLANPDWKIEIKVTAVKE